jgi:CheY-like chemotaxis protein
MLGSQRWLARSSMFGVRRSTPLAAWEAAMPAHDESAKCASRLRVLVAEDHADTAVSIARWLEALGYQVCLAPNGLIAVEAARDLQPDVALLDIGLPGVDGYEVARRIRLQRPEQRPLLIAITGWARDEDMRRAGEAGIDLHFHKPANLDQLARVLEGFQAYRARVRI